MTRKVMAHPNMLPPVGLLKGSDPPARAGKHLALQASQGACPQGRPEKNGLPRPGSAQISRRIEVTGRKRNMQAGISG
jgi:hypothetical protein